MNKKTYLTVKELYEACINLMLKGMGDKQILITTDDEGNGYHGLFYSFNTDTDEVRECYDAGLMHDTLDEPMSDYVLLG